MEELNLPRHVIETLEKRWARKLQYEAGAWQATKSPAPRSRTETGIPVERRSRRPRFSAAQASTL